MKHFPFVLARTCGLSFDLLEQLRSPQIESKESFEQAVIKARKGIQQYASRVDLQKGIMLSSLSFLERLQNYSQKDVYRFLKKERQTELKLFQYLSRSCAKTSPFSHFTALELLEIEEPANFYHSDMVSRVRLNQFLLAYLREMLELYLPFITQLPVSLNNTLKCQEETITYLFNSRNIEAIQQIQPVDEFTKKIIAIVSKAKDAIYFNDLMDALQDAPTDRESVENFIFYLIHIGLLEWKWPFSGTDPDWPAKLLSLLRTHPDFYLKKELKEFLLLCCRSTGLFEKAGVSDRLALQQDLKEAWRHLLQLLWPKIHYQNVSFAEGGKLAVQEPAIRTEEFLFEDCHRSVLPGIRAAVLEPITVLLKKVLDVSAALTERSNQKMLKKCWINHFWDQKQVGFLEFYEVFFKENKKPLIIDPVVDMEKLNGIQQVLSNFDLATTDGVLHINSKLLEALWDRLGGFTIKNNAPVSSLIQLYEENNLTRAVVNACNLGYGKMYARFLDLFPENFQEGLRKWNSELGSQYILAENRDASYASANLHVPLLANEISAPGGHNAPGASQIPFKDIVIREREGSLVLFQKSTGREIRVVGLGLEALDSRAPSYQILLAFGPEKPSLFAFRTLINAKWGMERKAVRCWPRIVVGDRLVVQRMQWTITPEDIPVMRNIKGAYPYYMLVNNWRRDLNIPERVFVSCTYPDKSRAGVHKPQYIDFANPVSVRLFSRLVKAAPEQVKIIEMLPLPGHMISAGGKRYVAEYAIQFSSR